MSFGILIGFENLTSPCRAIGIEREIVNLERDELRASQHRRVGHGEQSLDRASLAVSRPRVQHFFDLREAQRLFRLSAGAAAHDEAARGFDIDIRRRIVLKPCKTVQARSEAR